MKVFVIVCDGYNVLCGNCCIKYQTVIVKSKDSRSKYYFDKSESHPWK